MTLRVISTHACNRLRLETASLLEFSTSRPSRLSSSSHHLGTWEIFGRYGYPDIGSSVYDYGLASTTGNADRAWQNDIRVNSWMTQYFKIVFDRNHVEFNNPVTYASGKTQPTGNILSWPMQL